MKSGASMPGSSASEYLIYSYKRIPWERLTTSISWNLAWKCLIIAHIFVSLCCYNLFIAIFTVVITHRGNFILYLMPYTLHHRMTKPTKWPVHPVKSQISLGIRPVWSASSLCEGPNIYWRGQRRLWSDWEYDKTNKMTCAPSKVSDQPGHPPSLCVKDQTFIDVDSEDSDQTDSMTKPTKWPVRPTKPQFSLAIRPVWSASSLCEGPNIYWCGQRRLIRLRAW